MLLISRDHRCVKPVLSTIGQMRLKPDSRALGRGALGDAIDGRSREGKFIGASRPGCLTRLATIRRSASFFWSAERPASR